MREPSAHGPRCGLFSISLISLFSIPSPIWVLVSHCNLHWSDFPPPAQTRILSFWSVSAFCVCILRLLWRSLHPISEDLTYLRPVGPLQDLPFPVHLLYRSSARIFPLYIQCLPPGLRLLLVLQTPPVNFHRSVPSLASQVLTIPIPA